MITFDCHNKGVLRIVIVLFSVHLRAWMGESGQVRDQRLPVTWCHSIDNGKFSHLIPQSFDLNPQFLMTQHPFDYSVHNGTMSIYDLLK